MDVAREKNMKNLVCIEHKEGAAYPQENFNPGQCYPEYPFSPEEVNVAGNDAYELVRNCLVDLGLDKEHFGTPEWNPLGDLFKPGNFVIVKPNWVMHENENRKNRENSYECLVTHTACIRAICDYCLIALQGKGRLLVGDAPMQGCDFEVLLEKSRIRELTGFYRRYGFTLEIKDFRQYQSLFNRSKVIVGKKYNDNRSVTVSMGEKSLHAGAACNGVYQVSDYDKVETCRFHHDQVHDYEIVEDILQADVIINFCKPKTHRLAGITAAMKNMVGITYNKASLPHRTAGSVEEGGDAYLHKNLLKRIADDALTRKIRAERKSQMAYATLLRYVYGAALVTGRKFGKDPYYIGSWYGNDTIWRTVCDLNYLIRYADKSGMLQDTPQRGMLCLGDMIIAGERNGPVSPQPKELGCVIGSLDPVGFDVTLCKLMGFAFDRIPLVRNIIGGKSNVVYEEPDVLIHVRERKDQAPLTDTIFEASWSFQPHDAWK